MRQILAMNPADVLAPLVTQLGGLADGVSLPALGDLGSLAPPDVGALGEVIAQVGELAGQLSAGPGGFAGELLGTLKRVADAPAQIAGTLGGLGESVGRLGELGEQLPTLIAGVEEVAGLLAGGELDAAGLARLLPLDGLAAPLAAGLAPMAQEALVAGAAVELATFADGSWLAGYRAALAELKRPAAERNQATLDGATVAVAALAKQAGPVARDLDTLAGALAAASEQARAALGQAATLADPAALAAAAGPLAAAATKLEGLGVAGAATKLEPLLAAAESLAAQELNPEQLFEGAVANVLKAIEGAIEPIKQALAKLGAIVTDLLTKLAGLVAKLDLPAKVKQLSGAFATFSATATNVLDQVNQTIAQVYAAVRGLAQKLAEIKLGPMIDQLHALFAQVVALLDRPEVRQAIERAKTAIAQAAERLDSVSLKPVFDQVAVAADDAKAKLEAVDVSQLNAMVREALKQALGLVTAAIDPPTKVTEPLKQQYDETVKPVTTAAIDAVRQPLKQIAAKIDALSPAALAAELLTPLFDQLKATIEGLVGPERLKTLLAPLGTLYASLLATIEAQASPEKLLAPVERFHTQLLAFVDGLVPPPPTDGDPTPTGSLVDLVRAPIDQVGAALKGEIAGLLDKIGQPLARIEPWLSAFALPAPLRQLGAATPDELAASLQARIAAAIDGLDLAPLDPALAPLRAAGALLRDNAWGAPMLAEATKLTPLLQAHPRELAALADAWAQLPPETRAEHKALDPLVALAEPTRLLDRIDRAFAGITRAVAEGRKAIAAATGAAGQGLALLLAGSSDDLRTFLRQGLAALAAGPLRRLAGLLGPALALVRRAVAAVEQLKGKLDPLARQIPAAVERLRATSGRVVDALTAIDLGFLSDQLPALIAPARAALTELSPQVLLAELKPIFDRVMATVAGLNPEVLILAAHGQLAVSRADASQALYIPVGARLLAETPAGQKQFKVVQALALATGATAGSLSVRALAPSPGGDIVVPGGEVVKWSIELPEGLSGLTLTNAEPLLSLATLVSHALLAKLDALRPERTIVPLLEKLHERIMAIKEELGIERLFDALFARFESLEQELKAGMDRTAAVLGGLIAAIPL